MRKENLRLYNDVIETLSENREVTFEIENENVYIHISFEPPDIPIVANIDGYEIKRYNDFMEILEEYDINPETISRYSTVEMY